MHTHFASRRVGIVASLAVAAVIAAAGCSTESTGASSDPTGAQASATQSPSSPTSGTQQHNSADVMFNQMMIPHHQQAVEMAGLVESRTQNPAVRQLATAIAGAQQPEIDQMTARLKSWGVPLTTSDDAGHEGHSMPGHSMSGESMSDESMSGGSMSGMMSEQQMAAMTAASGAQFDTLWLQGMIAHHEGAVEMANTELAQGIDPGSRELATQIKNSQQAEITQMKGLLGQ